MPPDELIQLVGPWAAYLLVGIASLLAILKMLIPKAFDAAVARLQSREAERIRDREHERALESEKREEEQREQMALWTQMVELQTRVISQNEALLTWVIEKVGDDLQEFARDAQVRYTEIKAWLEKSTRQSIQSDGQMKLIQMELSRLVDATQAQTERMASLMAYYGVLEEEHRRE